LELRRFIGLFGRGGVGSRLGGGGGLVILHGEFLSIGK
jgi:hypothetical protein